MPNRDNINVPNSIIYNYTLILKDSSYQWTLSAPIQAPTQTLPSLKSTQHADDSSDDVTSTNQFCVTKPVPNNLTSWPYGVTKSTDTVLIEWWLSSASVLSSPADLKTLDENVKSTVSKWVMNELKYHKHVWHAHTCILKS